MDKMTQTLRVLEQIYRLLQLANYCKCHLAGSVLAAAAASFAAILIIQLVWMIPRWEEGAEEPNF
jgi:hypothetical protein